jgi:hypothetical protein
MIKTPYKCRYPTEVGIKETEEILQDFWTTDGGLGRRLRLGDHGIPASQRNRISVLPTIMKVVHIQLRMV